MWPVGTIGRLKSELSNREYNKGTDIPITVGILLMDYSKYSQFIDTMVKVNGTRKNIIDVLNSDTGDYIDFYIPGYASSNEIKIDGNCRDYYTTQMEIDGKTDYQFSPKFYDDAIDELQKDFGIDLSGESYLILVEWNEGRFNKDNFYKVDLKSDLDKIFYLKGSNAELFHMLISVSKKEVAFKAFKNKLRACKAEVVERKAMKQAVIEITKSELINIIQKLL